MPDTPISSTSSAQPGDPGAGVVAVLVPAEDPARVVRVGADLTERAERTELGDSAGALVAPVTAALGARSAGKVEPLALSWQVTLWRLRDGTGHPVNPWASRLAAGVLDQASLRVRGPVLISGGLNVAGAPMSLRSAEARKHLSLVQRTERAHRVELEHLRRFLAGELDPDDGSSDTDDEDRTDGGDGGGGKGPGTDGAR